jgi:2-succinyl-5-enolpyruvyl-6-hydroxy-3-cyclohexene-1-carboxylate synthase
VRWFAEVALPESTPAGLRYARALAARAFEVAKGETPGPVHLNLPFREPLDPRPVPGDVPADLDERDPLAARGRGDSAYTAVRRAPPTPRPDDVASLAERMRGCARGVVLCGPQDPPPDDVAAIAALARRLGWPLLAEPTSQLRSGPHVADGTIVTASHTLLSDTSFAADHAPDFVLRFGAAPTSKAVARWLGSQPPAHYVAVDPGALWHDPDHIVSELHDASPGLFCELLTRRLASDAAPTPWLERFRRAERAALTVFDALLADDALSEPSAVRELAAELSPEATVYVSNSMPVRDLDAFWPAAAQGPRVLCNRGANGIDGMVSSSLGAAVCGPAVLLTGDIALLHDASGLLTAKRLGLPLVIVVLDNDGGGIFSMLPVAEFGDAAAFTEHFRTPHGHDLAALCDGIGLANTRVGSWPHFRATLKDAMARPGPVVLVVPTDADANVTLRREITKAVSAALAEEAR